MSDVSMTSPSTRPGTATISRTRRCPDASEPRCTTRSTLAATVGTTKVVVNDCSCRRRPMISGLGALLGDTRQVGRGGFLPPRAGSLPSTTSCPRAVDAGAHGGVFSSTSLHEVAERAGGYSATPPPRRGDQRPHRPATRLGQCHPPQDRPGGPRGPHGPRQPAPAHPMRLRIRKTNNVSHHKGTSGNLIHRYAKRLGPPRSRSVALRDRCRGTGAPVSVVRRAIGVGLSLRRWDVPERRRSRKRMVFG